MTTLEAVDVLRHRLSVDKTGLAALDLIVAHMRRADALIRVLKRDPCAIRAAAEAIADEGLSIPAVSDAVEKAGRS